MKDPADLLDSGRRYLDPLLSSHGFVWEATRSGKGSGGLFASGLYRRSDRELELHFRYTLGLVKYRVGLREVDHTSYMRTVLGAYGGNKYPGVSSDPLDGFRDLAHDLERHCKVFLAGSVEEFEEIVEQAESQARVPGFKRLP